jgi:adenosylcobyric acid synthase
MSVFVLGTASHVGKSTVVAALCRVLSNRGITAAPFKAQNMSLNSFVTQDGAEIGIAQAEQASAARLEPEADMNPILLKPTGERVSQVVLMGRPYRDIPILDYYQETEVLLSHAVRAAERLMNRYGHIVAEGAGGAAEINLYDRDIANIRIERELGLPIILVADIERGGVFAQVYGTLELLPPDIRPLVMGIIINKFRGDPALFEDGIRIIEDLCGVPVLGVIPFISLPLPSEDSLSIEDKKACDHPIRIAVIRLPQISNFTDFESLERSAMVVYVRPGLPLAGYDCIIIPGTMNTVDDLRIVNESGCAAEIHAARERGVPIIGICGGYQMLGLEVIDEGVEPSYVHYEGLGLLRTVTRISKYEKTTERVTRTASAVGPILPSVGTVKGYEIQADKTERTGDDEAFYGEGTVSQDGLVIGTYLHGLFENSSAANALLSFLYAQKGLEYVPTDEKTWHDPYEHLAAGIERYVKLDPILTLFET